MSKKVKVNKVNNRKFEIVTPQRTYYFRGYDDTDTDAWIKAINDTIRDYAPDG